MYLSNSIYTASILVKRLAGYSPARPAEEDTHAPTKIARLRRGDAETGIL